MAIPENIREFLFWEIYDFTKPGRNIPPSVLHAIERFVVYETEITEFYIYWIGRQLRHHEGRLE